MNLCTMHVYLLSLEFKTVALLLFHNIIVDVPIIIA